MRTTLRLFAIAALVSTLALAESARAQSREFAGRVVSISAQSITVKDRRGETGTFKRGAESVVEGAEQSWDAIAKGDSVIVRWKLGDGTIWRVIVLEKGGGGR